MTLVLDPGVLFAQADADDADHEDVVALLESAPGLTLT